jgi:hypothetical protein
VKHVIEGKVEGRIEVTGRRGRRRKQLMYGLKVMRSDCKLKEEALDRAVWRTRFGRGCRPVVRQTVLSWYYWGELQYSKQARRITL